MTRTLPVQRALGLAGLIAVLAAACSGPRSDLAGAVGRRLASLAQEYDGFSVLIEVDRKVVLQRGFGSTGPDRKCPVTERTLFNIASITKSFTALAVLQLNEQKRLRLDATLPVFFSSVPPDKKAVTIGQLLTHTSGLGQDYAADGKRDRDAAVRAVLGAGLKFPPGLGFSYSNENYELLAAVLEVVTGGTFEEYVRARILAPSGMTDTKFWDEVRAFDDCRVAPPLRPLGAEVLGRNWGYIGSGGIYSNVVDLHRWFAALREGRLLGSEGLALLWKRREAASTTGIAYGWFLSETRGVREIWTRGSEDWGPNGVLRWFPERQALVIVQSGSGERGDKNITANRVVSDAIVEVLLGGGEGGRPLTRRPG